MSQNQGAYSWQHAGRMRVARAALGYNTAAFARRFNLKRRTVQRIENGEDPTPIGLWSEVQEALDDLRMRIDRVMDHVDGVGKEWVVDPSDDHLYAQAAAVVMVALDRGDFVPMTGSDLEGREDGDPGADAVPESLAGSSTDRSQA